LIYTSPGDSEENQDSFHQQTHPFIKHIKC